MPPLDGASTTAFRPLSARSQVDNFHRRSFAVFLSRVWAHVSLSLRDRDVTRAVEDSLALMAQGIGVAARVLAKAFATFIAGMRRVINSAHCGDDRLLDGYDTGEPAQLAGDDAAAPLAAEDYIGSIR